MGTKEKMFCCLIVQFNLIPAVIASSKNHLYQCISKPSQSVLLAIIFFLSSYPNLIFQDNMFICLLYLRRQKAYLWR